LIWDNGTRAELRDFLEAQRSTRRFAADPTDLADEAALSDAFSYSAHAKELVVGEIFLRIYNQQPTYPIEVSSAWR